MIKYLVVLAFVIVVGIVDMGTKNTISILVSSVITCGGTAFMMAAAGNPGLKNRYRVFFGGIAAIACGFLIVLGL
jgi:hypothetical protein